MNFKTIFLFLLLIPSASALTFYNITLEGKDALVNITFTLESDQKYDIWKINWELPQKSEVIYIKDERGPVPTYSVKDERLVFETNKYRSNKRTININLLVKNVVSDEFEPLYKLHLSLPGFTDQQTIANLHVPHIISGDASHGFTEYYEDNFVQFVGKESLDLIIFYSFSGKDYENYVLFGQGDLQLADELFTLIPNITGAKVPFKKFPVVVLSDNEFNEKIKYWGSGTHMRGGVIVMKKSAMNSPYNTSIILHETMHGFNAKIFEWAQVNATWFDEGIASFMEYLVNQKLNLKQGQIFGESVYFTQDGKKFLQKSRGNKEDLWNYYKNREDFMFSWNTDNAATRDFGYAFSELVIRDTVRQKGFEQLKEAYKEFKKVNKTITDVEEFNNIILGSLEHNFRPCYYLDRSLFEKCLEEINKQKIDIPGFVNNHTEEIIMSIITPEFNKTIEDQTNETKNEIADFIFKIKNFLISILDKIKNIFGITIYLSAN